MIEPIQGLPNPLIDRLATTLGTNAVQSFVNYLEQGVPLGQAYAMAFGNDLRHAGDRHVDNLVRAFTDLPGDVQQRIVQGADALPPPVREALDQLGIVRTQVRDQGTQQAALAREATPGPRSGGLPSNAAAAQAFGAEARAGAPGQVGNPFAAQEAAAQRSGATQPGGVQQTARAMQELVLPQQGDRAFQGIAAGRIQDPGQAVLAIERLNFAQQPLPSQAPAALQGRAETVAAQVLPTLGGATMLANPQATPLPGHVTLPAPPGTDAAAAQAREAQLAPAGHTVSGFLRRDLRRGHVQTPPARMPGGLGTLLANRRRPRDEDGADATPLHWLFWLLTVIAYGAVAVTVMAMLPGGSGLADGHGRPTYGGYALAVGAVAAIASWWLGRRLSRR